MREVRQALRLSMHYVAVKNALEERDLQEFEDLREARLPWILSAIRTAPGFDSLHRWDYDPRCVQGRIRSAERVEAHLSSPVSRTFFQPDVRTPGASMKGGRYVD